MKCFKSFISLITLFAVVLSSLCVSASSEAEIFFNEYFDNYATNGNSANLKIEKGTDARVALWNEKTNDKAAYGKSLRSSVSMSAAVANLPARYVVSADIMVDSSFATGNVISVKGSSAIPLIMYESNGTVRLGDGTRIGSYKLGEWKNYTFVINRSKQKYDLYINGKRAIENWMFTTRLSAETAINFELKKTAESGIPELYVDNVRVYSGSAILGDGDFPKVVKNVEEWPFSPSDDKLEIGDAVYLTTSGKKGFSPNLSPKTGTAEFSAIDGEEELRLHLARPGGTQTDVYADIFLNDTEDVLHYVYQIDVYPCIVSGTVNLAFMTDHSNRYFTTLQLTSGGNIKLNGNTVLKIPMNEWTNVAYVIKTDTETVDVYMNNVLKASDLPMASATPAKFRLGIANGNGAVDVYFDNIRVYEGSELRDFAPTDGDFELVSVAESNKELVDIIGNASVLTTSKDVIYTAGAKTTYTELGLSRIYENGVLYVETALADKVLGTETSYTAADGKILIGGAELTVGKTDAVNGDSTAVLDGDPFERDGKVYIPLASVAGDVLGKYVYKDDRGWILVSDNGLALSNSDSLKEYTEDSDVVDRFIQFGRPSAEELYTTVTERGYKQHPRLFTTPEQVLQLKENIKTNDLMSKWARIAISGADALINKPPVAYEIPDGLRLFLSCQEVRQRLYSYAVAYLITDDPKYAAGAWKEIENACNWPDWNVTRHYLDSGKIGPGMAVAYDVFYKEFTDEQKAFMREKITEHYLNFTRDAFVGKNERKAMLRNGTNWSAVCNTSILMWCLATMDEEAEDSDYTELTKFLAAAALQGLEFPISRLYPSGVWDEGISYFNYVLQHISWTSLSLRNACGTDYGVASYPGYTEMANYALYIQTPGNGVFNFSDGAGDGEIYTLEPEVFLIARFTGNQDLNDLWYNFRYNLMGDGYDRLDLLFYSPGETASTEMEFPLDKIFDGSDVSTMKSSWSNVSAPYAASLGGVASRNEHAHVGSFIYEALGERWAVDLGSDNYNIEGGYYHEAGQALYRKRAEGHNTIVINPDASNGQKIGAVSKITANVSKPRGTYTVYDLSDIYGDHVNNMQRGFMFGDDRNTLLIQDEISFKEANSDIYWFMHTKADIEVAADGKSAVLTQNGKQLRIEFESNLSEWKIEKRTATPLETSPERPGQDANEEFSKVTLVGKGSGDCYITAKLIPVDARVSYPGVSYTPISQWTIPDGEPDPVMNLESIQIDGYTLPGFDVLKTEYEYATTSATIPVVTATATKGTVSVTQASQYGDYALINLTDGTHTLTYRVKIEQGLIDSLKQSDNNLKPQAAGTTVESLTANTVQDGLPEGARRIPIIGFYSSDAQTGNPAEHLFDRDFASRWASDMEGAHVVVDMGETRSINGATFVFYDGNKRKYNFEIHVSEDNKNYTKVFAGTSTGHSDVYETILFDANARYVKFVGFGHATGAWNNMIEFSPITMG